MGYLINYSTYRTTIHTGKRRRPITRFELFIRSKKKSAVRALITHVAFEKNGAAFHIKSDSLKLYKNVNF